MFSFLKKGALAYAMGLVMASAHGLNARPPVPPSKHRRQRDLNAPKRQKKDRYRMAVVNGRITIAERVKLVGAKGMRP